jgi:hypothetical protein
MRREILPNRRRSELITFEHEGLRYHGSVSRYADGRLGEIFVELAKPGGAAGTGARDAAVAASLALQFGSSSEVLRKALTRLSDGSGAGPLAVLLDMTAATGIKLRIERIARDAEPPFGDKIHRLIELADEVENDGGAP